MLPLASRIAEELTIPQGKISAALELLGQGNTIPFIARYRKEVTGELDELQLRDIRDRHEYLTELEERRAHVIASIEEQGRMTEELQSRLQRVDTKSELEDLYRPYKPKRRTRATIAAERGLEPLAELIWSGRTAEEQLRRAAANFVDAALGVEDGEAALAGARDILAERVADDASARAFARELTWQRGTLDTRAAKGKQGESSKFEDYYDFSEPLKRMPGHRVLAIRRGESEGFLTAHVSAPEEEILAGLRERFVAASAAREQMGQVVADAYKRLISTSVEVELRTDLKNRADEEAIQIFGQNLEGLLLSSPAGGRVTLGIDPGYRTGCKLAVVSSTGALLETGVIYLHQEDGARRELQSLVERHRVELVAVGNGTASRESDRLARSAVRDLPADRRPVVVMVNEAGASVYSASEIAREEFPQLDLTLRSAISIARRLQDPLAELVKIDPKSIGVGQYQHDVSQSRLKRRLDETVESCVNRVGVEVNTASASLLSHVAGIGATVAHRIAEYRDQKGAFRSRRELLKVPGLGAKTFEQAAGFLRIRDGSNPLDASAVHPERYALVERIARDLGIELRSLVGDEQRVRQIEPRRYVGDGVGLPTLEDILGELQKPGRDPREGFEAPTFRDDVETLADLKEGMVLQGTVTNVVAFGAFVDVGVHQDGLVHISELSDRFVQDPNAVAKVGDRVRVTVLSVDLKRQRVALSMKSQAATSQPRPPRQSEAPRPAPDRSVSQPGMTNTKPKDPPEAMAPQEGFAANGMRIRRN
ncbi:Tex family protein [soil metagenome]